MSKDRAILTVARFLRMRQWIGVPLGAATAMLGWQCVGCMLVGLIVGGLASLGAILFDADGRLRP